MGDTATDVDARQSSDLGAVVESDGFRVESRSAGSSDESLKATMREFLESERQEAAHTEKPTEKPSETTPAVDAKPATDPDATPKPKSKPERRLDAIEQRIAEATKRAHAAENAAREAERLAEERRRALDTAAPAAPADGAKPTDAKPTDAKPADDPRPRWSGANGYEAAGKSFEEFEDDLGQWESRAEERRLAILRQTTDSLTEAQREEREAAEQQRRERYFDQRHAQRYEELIADPDVATAFESPEFKEMPATPFMTTLIKLHDQGAEVMKHFALNPAEGYAFSNLALSREIKEAFRESSNPVGLISALVNDPEEASRIAQLSGTRAHRALWALEHEQRDAKVGPSAAVPRKQATPLPAKVQASRSVAVQRPITELTTDDMDEFLRREEAEGNI